MLLDPQDVQWALYTKKGHQQVAAEERCWACASVAKRAFPHLAWLDIVSRCRTSQDFAASVHAARQILLNPGGAKTFIPETLNDHSSVDILISKHLLFLSVEEFTDKFGCKPESMNLSVTEVPDEQNHLIRGVFVKHPQKPFREVVVQRQSRIELTKHLLDPAQQLRQAQGQDLSSWLLTQRAKTDAATQAVKNAPSTEEIEAKVDMAKAKERREESERGAPASMAPLNLDGKGSLDVAPALVSTITESFAEQYAEQARQQHLQAGKGNGRGRGGRGCGARSAVPAPAPKRASVKRGILDNDDGTASVRSTKTAKNGTAAEKVKELFSQAVTYAGKDPLDALVGQSQKSNVYNGSRVLTALEEEEVNRKQRVCDVESPHAVVELLRGLV